MDRKMEWNERFQEWNGRQSSILDFLHCIYRNICNVRMSGSTNNIVTGVFNFNTYGYYLSTNHDSLVMYIHCANGVCIAL